MRVRYKNNMTGREIIGQKRLLFTIKPALFKKELLHILCTAVPFGYSFSLFFSRYTVVEGKAKSTPSACITSMMFRFRSFCCCRKVA